jgi:capsular polysaccharide biosynthesis protein
MKERRISGWLLRPPDWQEISAVLCAWRLWVLGAALGALVGTVAYFLFPPLYRAQATILIDQNVEQVIVQEASDLRKYTYLQRETDKLIEIAKSDAVLRCTSEQTGVSVESLRDGRLSLSQPSDGGWHFRADDSDAEQAQAMASAWARCFYETLLQKPAGISPLLEVNPVQVDDLPVGPAVSMAAYIFGGSLFSAAFLALLILFIHPASKRL